MKHFSMAIAVIGALTLATAARAADWAQFRGPNRDGICAETGLIDSFPESGPKLLWKVENLGKGFATVSIVGNRIFTAGDRDGDQFVIALDLNNQKELWATRVGKAWTQSNDPGARGTPTVDGDLLYIVGSQGDVVCMESATGKELWRKNFAQDFGGKMMSIWGYAESPLIDGEKCIVTPGGPDAAVVALNKKTGEVIWKTKAANLGPNGADGAGYCSAVVSEACGVRQYVTIIGRGLIGVRASDGALLWSNNKVVNKVANISSPVVKGDFVFASTAYKTGSTLVKLSRDGEKFKADEVYFLDANTFQNHHGGVVLVGDHLYGGHGQNAGQPVCIEFATGKIVWKAPKAPDTGSAAVLYVDGKLIFRFEGRRKEGGGGKVYLLAPSPEGYKEISSFRPPTANGPSWSHPVVHNGKLYLRDQHVLLCYDVKK